MLELNKVYRGDCLEVMKDIDDGSVDMVMADPPYGTTACKWDSIIPLEPMWKHLKRVIKKNGAIVLTASQPFTTTLISSNMGMFRYEWIWEKNQPSGIATADILPMKNHENILIFYRKTPTYNKQKTRSLITDRKLGRSNGKFWDKTNIGVVGLKPKKKDNPDNILRKYVNPRTVIFFKVPPNSKGKLHVTQKPVALMEYLIKTYTNEGDTVLDFCAGSGTTGVACKIIKRNFILIEQEEKYVKIARQRIKNPDHKPIKQKTNNQQPGLFPQDKIDEWCEIE